MEVIDALNRFINRKYSFLYHLNRTISEKSEKNSAEYDKINISMILNKNRVLIL